MAEPYSKPQNDLPPPLPSEPEEFNVPTVQSDPPGYSAPSSPPVDSPAAPPAPAPQPVRPAPPVTFTPPAASTHAAQPRPAASRPVVYEVYEAPADPPAPPTVPPTMPPGPPSGGSGPAKKRGLRSLFWPGFVAGFMLLAGMSCGGAVVATGISRLNLSDLQDAGAAWTPPPVTATPVVVDQSSSEESVQDSGGIYQAGDVVRNITSSNVNIRASAGYLSKPAGDVVAQVRPGEAMQILGERAAAGNLTWWRIRYQPASGGVVEGWVAEATASGVQILSR